MQKSAFVQSNGWRSLAYTGAKRNSQDYLLRYILINDEAYISNIFFKNNHL